MNNWYFSSRAKRNYKMNDVLIELSRRKTGCHTWKSIYVLRNRNVADSHCGLCCHIQTHSFTFCKVVVVEDSLSRPISTLFVIVISHFWEKKKRFTTRIPRTAYFFMRKKKIHYIKLEKESFGRLHIKKTNFHRGCSSVPKHRSPSASGISYRRKNFQSSRNCFPKIILSSLTFFTFDFYSAMTSDTI